MREATNIFNSLQKILKIQNFNYEDKNFYHKNVKKFLREKYIFN